MLTPTELEKAVLGGMRVRDHVYGGTWLAPGHQAGHEHVRYHVFDHMAFVERQDAEALIAGCLSAVHRLAVDCFYALAGETKAVTTDHDAGVEGALHHTRRFLEQLAAELHAVYQARLNRQTHDPLRPGSDPAWVALEVYDGLRWTKRYALPGGVELIEAGRVHSAAATAVARLWREMPATLLLLTTAVFPPTVARGWRSAIYPVCDAVSELAARWWTEAEGGSVPLRVAHGEPASASAGPGRSGRGFAQLLGEPAEVA